MNTNTILPSKPPNTPVKVPHFLPPPFPCDSTTFIYPSQLPFRYYQYSIFLSSLFYNTLACVPTGLGKTHIAACLILNFHRWFPNQRILFIAPTKPLVNQQIDACFKVGGISPDAVTDITGSKNPQIRKRLWETKRIFFLTPQVAVNDLVNEFYNAKSVVLVVVDEAHRSTGNHSNCQGLMEENETIRILALSATPANNAQTIQNVITNLCIAKIEQRTEESGDVAYYRHKSDIQEVIVSLTPLILEIAKHWYILMKQPMITLSRLGVRMTDNPEFLGAYSVQQTRERWRKDNQGNNSTRGFGESEFTLLHSMTRMKDLLLKHGIRSFYSFVLELDASVKNGSKGSKTNLVKHPSFQTILRIIKEAMQNSQYVMHPKIEKLVSILLEHFANSEQGSKVIIFSEFRDTVDEIVKVLEKHQPMVRAHAFVGQNNIKGGGLKQKDQLRVVEAFKCDMINVLVSTSIGEEGLDIGQVDLIVCYDSANSPIRMLQRMGRTGRKREGRVVMLLTEKKEEANFKRAQSSYKSIQKAIASHGSFTMYDRNPSMVPAPELTCEYLYLVAENRKVEEKVKKKKALTIIDQVDAGFATAAQKLKGTKKKKVVDAVILIDDDDDIDRLIMENSFGNNTETMTLSMNCDETKENEEIEIIMCDVAKNVDSNEQKNLEEMEANALKELMEAGEFSDYNEFELQEVMDASISLSDDDIPLPEKQTKFTVQNLQPAVPEEQTSELFDDFEFDEEALAQIEKEALAKQSHVSPKKRSLFVWPQSAHKPSPLRNEIVVDSQQTPSLKLFASTSVMPSPIDAVCSPFPTPIICKTRTTEINCSPEIVISDDSVVYSSQTDSPLVPIRCGINKKNIIQSSPSVESDATFENETPFKMQELMDKRNQPRRVLKRAESTSFPLPEAKRTVSKKTKQKMPHFSELIESKNPYLDLEASHSSVSELSAEAMSDMISFIDDSSISRDDVNAYHRINLELGQGELARNGVRLVYNASTPPSERTLTFSTDENVSLETEY